MLSKEQCKLAVNNWKITRPDYSKINELINPTSVFNFSPEDCQWISENSKKSDLHTYIGAFENQLFLIVVPLDTDGTELNLANYLATPLSPLAQELILSETDVVTTTKKTTLSTDLAVTKDVVENDLPTTNEPTITERVSVNDIEQWKNECSDWFYYESTNHGGERIFRTFEVPFADLTTEIEEHDSAVAFFGFKHSAIYNMQIPILIFVSLNSQTAQGKIMRNSELVTNTKDYSHPCPPACKNSANYTIFNS
mgnify:CR=1 FL=1